MNESKQFDNWKTRISIISIIIFLWIGCWYLLLHNSYLNDFTTRGQFGDMFGVVNSLFSGLAFGGIIYTILLQREELKAQREELKLTKQEFITQNETLRLQRFENTFFNLLDVHNKIVASLKYTYHTLSGDRFESEGREIFNDAILSLSQTTELMGNPKKYSIEDFNKQSQVYKNILSRSNSLSGLTYYFQSLVSILEFVSNTSLLSEKENVYKDKENREFYFQLLTSSQSITEKSIIFYHIAFGWQVSQLNDYLSRLRVIEKRFSIYENSNVSFLPTDHNYHMYLLKRFFELFST
jgi:hypothetical protein